jgi:hypothetical protein
LAHGGDAGCGCGSGLWGGPAAAGYRWGSLLGPNPRVARSELAGAPARVDAALALDELIERIGMRFVDCRVSHETREIAPVVILLTARSR